MVVLVLIGIIFSFATLSLRGDDVVKLMEQEARRLETLLALVNDEAIVRGEELGIRFGEDGYEFVVLEQDGWTVPDDAMLRSHDLPADLHLKLELEGDQAPDAVATERDKEPPPQVLILSSGEMTPFSVIFDSRLSDYRYRLSATILGDVSRSREGPL